MSEVTEKRKKRKSRPAEIIGYVFIALIIAALLLVLALRATKHTVFIFNRTTIWVMTPSMEPEIPERSYILIKKTAPEDVKVGDVIVFRSDDPLLNGAFNTHRVVGIVGDNAEFITRGDANLKNDDYTAKAQNVIGVYVGTLPVLTAMGRFLFTGMGMIITVTVVFAIMMAMYVPEIVRATRRRTEELEEKRKAIIDEKVREEVERMKAENAAGNAKDAGTDETKADEAGGEDRGGESGGEDPDK